MSQKPRVRFAPSPTGYLHVGGARTALFNWLFARKAGGSFILRIEDTDRERSSDEMSAAILEGMRWLGLDWDEGPVHQADGIERHRADVQRLLDSGHAYRCFCSSEDLQQRREAAEAAGGPGSFRYDRRCALLETDEVGRRIEEGEPHTIRFRVPEGETEWDDIVHGPTRFRNREIDDFIILRTDGTPIYNLAVVSDDVQMRITHVIRGDDHLSNTPRQLMLYRALAAPEPHFAHVPMILGADGRRLSKRHGAMSIDEYRKAGILPQALVNFLALLGWNPGDDVEIMLPDELIERFTLERILKKSAIFDPEKLEWMNGQHILLMQASEVASLLAEALIEAGLTTAEEVQARSDWFEALAELLRARGRTIPAIAEQARIFLVPEVEYDLAAVEKHWKDREEVIARLQLAREALTTVEPWAPEEIEAALRRSAAEENLGFGRLVHPLRLALTGSQASPGIDQLVWLLGREQIRERIDSAIAFLERETRPD